MTTTRRYVLSGVLTVVGAVTAAILLDVFATVFFAITVAVVVAPADRWLVRRGLSRWWAAAVTTTGVFLAVVLIFLPLVLVPYVRRVALLKIVRSVPTSVQVRVFDVVYTLDAADVQEMVVGLLQSTVVDVVRALPVLGIKVTLFAFVVFALLIGGRSTWATLLSVVPPEYRDVPVTLGDRARDTLFAIYVLQAVTAVGTGLIALPIFSMLGYDFPVTLSILAAVLQFLPVVGPSVVVGSLVVWELYAGTVLGAALVAALGFTLVAYLPDVLIRPRLARLTADMPGSLYFIGFTGGLLSVGPVGLIAGPLAVSLLVESVELLAEETNSTVADYFGIQVDDEADTDGAAGTDPLDRPTTDAADDSPTGGGGNPVDGLDEDAGADR